MTNTYARINLTHLLENYDVVRRFAGDKQVICIVKADAYGHGAQECARALSEHGASYFGVASVDEAIHLRQAGIRDSILILGYVPFSRIEEGLAQDVTFAVYSLSFAKALNEAAKECGKQARVHVKLNTGMSRLGFSGVNKGIEAVKAVYGLDMLELEGLFSHFATADEEDLGPTKEQYACFEAVVKGVRDAGIEIPMIHIENSAGTIAFGAPITTAVRPGIILYGVHPSDYLERTPIPIKPVMSFLTSVANLSNLEPGECVSYGRHFTAKEPRRVATLCAGYADGYFRALSSKAHVWLKGVQVPVLGNICMDMCMVDATDAAGVQVGDEAELFGEHISVSELARLAGTIPYELVCAVSKRVERIYVTE